MRKFKIAVALAGPGMMVGPALAQDDVTPAPLAGVWSLGETASCGAPAALRIWRDEGDAIAYTHAHMPYAGHERPMRVRHLTIEERSSERLVTRNYRGVARIFHRCPATSLKAPKGQSGH